MALRHTPIICCVLALAAFAADKTPVPKKEKPKLDLGLPAFTPLPKTDGLTKKPEPAAAKTDPSTQISTVEYLVVRVQHAKSFIHTPDGAKPSAPYEQVTLTSGNMTEKFSTVVRVKCTQKTVVPIEIAILDTRADTVMEAKGSVAFRGEKTPETDYTVDWEPTFVRGPGDFTVLVRLAGEPKGNFPLKVADAVKK